MQALVLEGGGMRAGWVTGALMALMDMGIRRFDAAAAVSASVPSLAYFAAGQRDSLEAIWRHELNSEKLVSYRNLPLAALFGGGRFPVLNNVYLVDHIIAQKYPIDQTALHDRSMALYFAATRVPTGKSVLLQPDRLNLLKILKACLAVPACSPGPVTVGNGRYMDGGIANPLPLMPLSRRLRVKRTRVLAILSKPPRQGEYEPTPLERLIFRRYFQKHPWVTRCLQKTLPLYVEQVRHLKKRMRSQPPKAMVIHPRQMPPAEFITRDRRKINQTIDSGYRAVKQAQDRIFDFLQR